MYVRVSVKDKLVVSQIKAHREATVYSLVLYKFMGCWSVPHGPVLAELIVSNQTAVLEQTGGQSLRLIDYEPMSTSPE